jgi:hypothetical protein
MTNTYLVQEGTAINRIVGIINPVTNHIYIDDNDTVNDYSEPETLSEFIDDSINGPPA